VYDVSGRVVATLAEGTFRPGRYPVSWNAGSGRIPAGVYFFRLETPEKEITRKIVFMR
jgi:hypothetical protein